MDHKSELVYQQILQRVGEQFPGDGEVDLNSLLFLIGVQEVGAGFRKYSKDEKMNLIHVAICTILEPYGFYKFTENDADGWPHFEKLKSIPALSLKEQEDLMKDAVINYILTNEYFGFSQSGD